MDCEAHGKSASGKRFEAITISHALFLRRLGIMKLSGVVQNGLNMITHNCRTTLKAILSPKPPGHLGNR